MLLAEKLRMKSNVMTDAVLYARVSSKEQAEEGFSIPAQRHLIAGKGSSTALRVSAAAPS